MSFAQPIKLCGDTKFRHGFVQMTSYRTVESSFVVNKKVVCVDLLLKGFLQDLAQSENLVNGGFARSKAALIRSNQSVDDGLQSFTYHA